METKQERVMLTAAVQADQVNERLFDVLAITAGNGNGWLFNPDCLKASLALWDGVEIFIDHHTSPNRSLRDLAGIGFEPQFDAEQNGVRLKISSCGPERPLITGGGRGMADLCRAAPTIRVQCRPGVCGGRRVGERNSESAQPGSGIPSGAGRGIYPGIKSI